MKNFRLTIQFLLVIIGLSISSSANAQKPNKSRQEQIFNDNWKFLKRDNVNASNYDFDDTNWQTIDLPHDFSIMDISSKDTDETIGPFSKKSPGNGNTVGHVLGGTAWYRKTFSLDKANDGKSAIIKFDGVYMISEIWVNGEKVGANQNGYTPFWFDITKFFKKSGAKNTIAVKVDNNGVNSRWYSGSGIYRDVSLILTEKLHVGIWGTKITTNKLEANKALVDVEIELENETKLDAPIDVLINIKDSKGIIVSSLPTKATLLAFNKAQIKHQLTIANPHLWDIDSPQLYTAQIIITKAKKTIDSYEQKFGVRVIELSAKEGFKLNGKTVSLKGACLHHDNGYLGAAAIERAEKRKVELLKKSGFNAIRCSHNPPSEVFLNACDELGMLVINEFTDVWENYKNADDYSNFFTQNWEKDLTAMMKRDRNHPSIIMWSIGNEIPKKSIEEGVNTAKKLVNKVKELDASRFVTEAVPSFLVHGGWKNTYNYFDLLDASGYNYMYKKYEEDHEKYPNRVMYGSESFPNEAFEYWDAVEQKPYVIGDFVWTGMDYIGEAALGTSKYVKEIKPSRMQTMDGIPVGTNPKRIFDYMATTPSLWPNYISWCGDLDLMGDKKPQSLYRDILWDKSLLEMNVHEPTPDGLLEEVSLWGWPNEKPIWDWAGSENKPLNVRVFSKASLMKLELNGVLIGEKKISKTDKYIANFTVPYQSGKLTAIAFENGKEIARKTLVTPNTPTKLRLTADRLEIKSDKRDLSFVKAELVDNDGNLVTTVSKEIEFSIDGVGQIVATGNASPVDMQSVNNLKLKTFNGKAQAIIRAKGVMGKITVKVNGQDLKSGTLNILVK